MSVMEESKGEKNNSLIKRSSVMSNHVTNVSNNGRKPLGTGMKNISQVNLSSANVDLDVNLGVNPFS